MAEYDNQDDFILPQSRYYQMDGVEFERSLSHFTGKGPRNFDSDKHLWERVCRALADNSHLDATEINVEVKAREVHLTGEVVSRQDKKLAEDIIEHIPGVKDIFNRLQITSNLK
jgi:osmotically-inducible protein OsmY